jgi:hypothetical protein
MPTDFGATVTAPLLEEIGPDHIGLRCQRWGGSNYRHSGSSGARPGFPRLRHYNKVRVVTTALDKPLPCFFSQPPFCRRLRFRVRNSYYFLSDILR